MAKTTGLTIDQVSAYARRAGLRKDPEWERHFRRAIALRPGNRLVEHCFKPNHGLPRSPNAGPRPGTPGWEKAQANLRRGPASKDQAPIGTYRVRSGRLLQKVVLSGKDNDRWRPVHRLVWEAAHGPVPAGHSVYFKQGMATTVLEEIKLDRLELLDRREAALRHMGGSLLPEEQRKLLRTTIVLQREVRKYERKVKNHEQ